MSRTAKNHDQGPGEIIRSPRNPRVGAALRLHRKRHRTAAGRALLEGPKLLAEAVGARVSIIEVFGLPDDAAGQRLAERAEAEWIAVDPRVLARLATTEQPQSPVAVFAIPAPVIPGDGHLLVAWGVGDPGNVGTLIRTAAAFGMAYAGGPGTVDSWSPKVLRSAAGGHFRVPIGATDDPAGLRAAGRSLVATVVSGGDPPETLAGSGSVALLVGEEASGLPAAVTAACDRKVTIPMPGGTESLNAAVAGAITAYELMRDRDEGAESGH
jgi:TrmH family RNA methyltransferase